MEAEFSVQGLRFWIVDIATKHSCTVTVTECIPWRKKGGQALFRIQGLEDDHQRVIDEIRHRDDISSLDAVEREDGQITGSVGMTDFAPAWDLAECGCFLESVRSEGNGKAYFKILAGSEGSIPDLIKLITSKGLDIEIIRIAQTSERSQVTRKQEMVVRAALERGYFDYPRRITLEELAKVCNTSLSTVTETLKRGEKNILRHYFESGKR
jgi:predicted DNA binding protein